MKRTIHRAANCAAVSMPAERAEKNLIRAITFAGKHGKPHLVSLTEVSPIDVRRVAARFGWEAIQLGRIGSPEAGVAVAYDPRHIRLTDVSLEIGTEATSEGGGIRMRPILTFTAWTRRGGIPEAVGHTPPPRAEGANERFTDKVQGTGGIVYGDFNRTKRQLLDRVKRKVRVIGVVGMLIPRWVLAGKATGVEIGSDHLAVDVPVRIPRRPRWAHRNPWKVAR